MPLPVVVVGGGIAGLAAAYELHRRGTPLRLFEATTRAGGVIVTERVGPYLIDGGPDSVVMTKGGAAALCQELGLADRLIPPRLPRTAYVVRRGRLRPLPEPAIFGLPTDAVGFARTPLLSLRGRARALLDLLLSVNTPADDGDESLAAFFGRRLGREAVEYIVEPLLAGIHAGNVERLSIRAVLPSLVEAEAETGSMIRALGRLAAKRAAIQDTGPFRGLLQGMEQLVTAIVDRLPADRMHLGCAVTAVRLGTESPYEVETESGETHRASAVILAVPAYAVAALVEGLDQDLAELCRQIRYTSSAVVVLAYPRDQVAHPLAGTGFVVPRVERNLGILAASWITSKWPGRAPPDTVLVRGFVDGSRNPDALAQSDRNLGLGVHADLSRLLGIRSSPTMTRVYRWERANPQHEVGHLGRLAAINRRLARLQGLFLTGSGFRGVGISDCIADGRHMARRAVSEITRVKLQRAGGKKGFA